MYGLILIIKVLQLGIDGIECNIGQKKGERKGLNPNEEPSIPVRPTMRNFTDNTDHSRRLRIATHRLRPFLHLYCFFFFMIIFNQLQNDKKN